MPRTLHSQDLSAELAAATRERQALMQQADMLAGDSSSMEYGRVGSFGDTVDEGGYEGTGFAGFQQSAISPHSDNASPKKLSWGVKQRPSSGALVILYV